MKLSLLLLCTLSLTLQAQTLVQSSIAAAGGSVAGVAGKKVSEGVDKVLGKLSDVTDEAAATINDKTGKKPRSLPQEPGIPKASAAFVPRTPAMPVSRAVAPPRPGMPRATQNIAATRGVKAVDAADVYLPPPMPEPAAPVEVRQPSAEDLQAVSAGATRDQLADRMGRPSAKITMAEDGKLVEVYTYRNAGTVRLVDGTVADIRLK